MNKPLLIISLSILLLLIISALIWQRKIRQWLYVDTRMELTQPIPHQVIQQDNDGKTTLKVKGRCGLLVKQLEYAVKQPDEQLEESDWQPLEAKQSGINFTAEITLPVGMHHLYVRSLTDKGYPTIHAPVEVGVGDVYIVAGQSNALGSSSTLSPCRSANVKTAAYHQDELVWKICHDPQAPGGRGSYWPEAGRLLSEASECPVGFVNIAVGGTSITQWQPNTHLGDRLDEVAANIPHRAILWHQGESDKDKSEDEYFTLLENVLDRHKESTWYVALVTYQYLKTFPEIREAQRRTWQRNHVHPGPNTDLLDKPYRDTDGIHFNHKGNQKAAKMWVEKIVGN